MLAVSSERPSAAGARLVEMDRLLHDIQLELAPDRDPAPALEDEPPPAAPRAQAPDPGPGPSTAPPVVPEPHSQVISELSVRLLASMRELLAGYEQVLVGRTEGQATRRPLRRRPESPDVTLSAAPFVNLEALHEFEQAVSGLPGVREVVIRGYEGTDRAIIEVRLDGRSA